MCLSLMNFEFLDFKDPYLKQNTTEKPLFFIFALRHIKHNTDLNCLFNLGKMNK